MFEKIKQMVGGIVDPTNLPPERLLKEQVVGKTEGLARTFTQDLTAGERELRELLGADIPHDQQKEIVRNLKAKTLSEEAVAKIASIEKEFAGTLK